MPQRLKFFLSPVKDCADAAPHVDFALYGEVGEEGRVEVLLTQRFVAPCHGARCGAGGKESVYAGGAHCVVAFWVYEEGEAGVEVAVRFADGAYVGCWVDAVASEGLAARHGGRGEGESRE